MPLATRSLYQIFKGCTKSVQPRVSRRYTTKGNTSSSNDWNQKTNVKKPTATASSGAAPKSGYQVPEYYQHNTFSFVDYDVVLAKHRLPQPSNKK